MTATQPKVISEGTLIRLREKTVDDAEHDYAWRVDPELAAYDAVRPMTMRFASFLASMSEELQYPTQHRRTFGIEDRATGKHIGNVMYYGYDTFLHEAELGITIGDRDYWSHGFGRDAVRTMLRYLFQELRLRRVYLHTLTWNGRAQTSFTKAGFRRVREVRRAGYDFVYMEAVPEDLERDESPASSEQ
ncbi:MAG: N-acetyltransferase [Dehalococcoidia bacterium]|nr:N-acetyltransferase [Dehalococcoidia bacterium]